MNNGEELVVSLDARAGRITFNRPHLHNAISRDMWLAVPERLNNLVDEGARVIVLAGSGESFVSGADLGEIEEIDSFEKARQYWFAIRDCLNSFYDLAVPVLAEIDGPCLGGGLLLALACDLRLATSRSTFALPVSKLGIILDQDNIDRLVNSAGQGLACELLYRGDTISSARAYAAGMINFLCESGEIKREVAGCVRDIAGNDSLAIAAARRALRRARNGARGQDATGEKEIVDSYLRAAGRIREQNRKPGR